MLLEELKLLGAAVTPAGAPTKGSKGSKVKKGLAGVDDGTKVEVAGEVSLDV
jgi:hypothetical protein